METIVNLYYKKKMFACPATGGISKYEDMTWLLEPCKSVPIYKFLENLFYSKNKSLKANSLAGLSVAYATIPIP